MLSIAMYIPGADEESRLLRSTLCGICNLMAVLLFRSISDSVKNRFKTLQDVVDAGYYKSIHILTKLMIIRLELIQRTGFMTKEEKEIFESVKADINMFWLPALWFAHYMREAQKNGKITYNDGARLIMAVSVLRDLTVIFH